MSFRDLEASHLADYARDGFLVLEGFLPPADCDALQARVAELVAGFDPGPVRSIFSTHDAAAPSASSSKRARPTSRRRWH